MNCTIKCCKDCTDRQEGCHSTCETYKAEKEQWDNLRREEKARQRQEYCRMNAIMEGKKRMMKKKKWG